MRSAGRRLIMIVAANVVACSGAPAESPRPVTAAARQVGAAAPLPSSAPAPSTAPTTTPATTAEPPVQLATWERRIEAPIASFALGKKRFAALGRVDGRYGPAWIFDRDKLLDAPIPERLLASAAQRDDLRIHFGRDDWPRILGSRFEGDRARGVYLRHRNGWKSDAGEIARLLQVPDAAFYGVIGHDDPEVVCEVADICIIKRNSGWTMVPAGSERLHVELSSGVGWGLGPASASRMTDRGWERVGGEAPWKAAGGVWGNAEGTALWVSEPATDSLHRWDGQRWSRHSSPVAGPRGLWGAAHDDVWLAASGGIAHYDGTAWRRVAAPEGAFDEVRGRGPRDVWIGGAKGLWQGSR